MTSTAAPSAHTPHGTKPSTATYVLWAIGTLAYLVAVFNRTSFGVAVLPAAHRFGASASALSAFAVVQLLVYAGMQVPVGVLLDRWGARRLLVLGAASMAIGQLGLAFATNVPTALLMRVFIGGGDAMTFISVLHVVHLVFPSRRIPVITQMTAMLGQIGGILSAYPLAAALAAGWWTASFAGMGGLGVLVGILVAVALRVEERPRIHAPGSVQQRIRGAWRHPGTRLGLWSHFSTQFPQTVFQLLWGFPFLMTAEGLSRNTASALFTANLVAGLLFSSVIGPLVVRHPYRRSWLVISVILACMAAWTVVLAWPGRAPLWLLVVLVLVLACGPPGSMIGFDYARSFNPAERLGTATGIVNAGGFTASLLLMLLMGIVLDALEPTAGGHYSLHAFRWAFGLQYAFWALGLSLVLVARHKVRRRLVAEGVGPARSHQDER